jgi:aldehyde dehydrogenase (NAD+)
MILKPSEFTPTSALIFAEILHEAGVPKGVFNLINGLGPEVGAAMSEHPDIDMISFTGSTRAGVDVAKARRADGQARQPGTRRQVGERDPGRR